MSNLDDLVDQIADAAEDELRQNMAQAAEQARQAVANFYAAHGHRLTGKTIGSIQARILEGGLGFKIVVPTIAAAMLEHGSKHEPAQFPLKISLHQNFATTLAIVAGGEK